MGTTEVSRRLPHFTPDRCVIGLVAWEGTLYLSEQLRWVTFEHHRAWTGFFALAAVGIVVPVLLTWFAVSFAFRRRFQFSISSLLALAAVVAVSGSWLTRAERQREAAQAIVNMGGWVQYDYEVDEVGERTFRQPPGPAWVRKLLGRDFIVEVDTVYVEADAGMERVNGLTGVRRLLLGKVLDDSRVTDAGVRHIETLTQLRSLSLAGTKVTDEGLQHLERLSRLETLYLFGTRVTDDGAACLKALPRLRRLDLGHTRVTDAVLATIGDLSHLEWLSLQGTEITDQGIRHLAGLSRLHSLDLRDTRVSDAAMEHLGGLPQLHTLSLSGTEITNGALERLSRFTSLHHLSLSDTRVSDAGLDHLRRLPNLQELHLNGTGVTATALEELRKALPNCFITPGPRRQ